MTNPTTELLPWIVGIHVLVLALLRAVPRRHSRRRRYAHRKGPRSSASRPRGKQFPRELLPGRARCVVDGDSIEADVSGFGRLSIRLANVDAPEHDQPWGREAREALARLVRGGRPEFRLLYRDQYGRVIGLVSVSGHRGERATGSATDTSWAYERYLPEWLRARYKGFERAAQASRSGTLGRQGEAGPALGMAPSKEWRRLVRLARATRAETSPNVGKPRPAERIRIVAWIGTHRLIESTGAPAVLRWHDHAAIVRVRDLHLAVLHRLADARTQPATHPPNSSTKSSRRT